MTTINPDLDAQQAQWRAEEDEVRKTIDGPTWNTEELQRDFSVIGFALGHVVVMRRADNVKGSLAFNHRPRVYYGWVEA